MWLYNRRIEEENEEGGKNREREGIEKREGVNIASSIIGH